MVGVAVKVTEVPAQMGPEGEAAMLTEAVGLLTVTTALTFRGQPRVLVVVAV